MKQKFLQTSVRTQYKIAFAVAVALGVSALASSRSQLDRYDAAYRNAQSALQEKTKWRKTKLLEIEVRKEACQTRVEKDLCLSNIESMHFNVDSEYMVAKLDAFCAELTLSSEQAKSWLLSTLLGLNAGLLVIISSIRKKSEATGELVT